MALKRFKDVIKSAQDQLKNAPEGRIVVSKNKGSVQFYQSLGKNNRKYISLEKEKLIKALSQKLYNEKVIKVLESQIEYLETYLQKIDLNSLSKVYETFDENLKPYITPYELPADEFAKVWEESEYKKCSYNSSGLIYSTDKGEMVRSKSEVIIANKLYAKGIPYRYECELKLDSGITLYPDFTVLNKTNRKEYILEHFGMMDTETYANNFVKKINTYVQYGYTVGKNLFCTFETSQEPFSSKQLDCVIKTLLS